VKVLIEIDLMDMKAVKQEEGRKVGGEMSL
jgi:hypothetical protein